MKNCNNRKYIAVDQLPPSGIIFVRREDIYSQIVAAIIKQPFTTIGFYYRTTVTGRSVTQVILVDVFQIKTPKWLDEGATLEHLLNDPLISQIAVKGLRPIRNPDQTINEEKTRRLECDFRTAICLAIVPGPEVSLEESLNQLFGHPVKCPTVSVTAVEMVNRVTMEIGRWEDVPQNGSLSAEAMHLLKSPAILNADHNGRIQMLRILASNFTQQEVCQPDVSDKLMQSYIVSNDLYGDLLYLHIPNRDANLVRKHQDMANCLNKDYLGQVANKFMYMLINDELFFKTVLEGFNQNRMMEQTDDKAMQDSLIQLASTSEELATHVTQLITKGEGNYLELMKQILKLNTTKECIEQKHCMKLCDNTQLPIIKTNRMLLLHKKGQGQEVGEMVKALVDLRHQVSNVAGAIAGGDTAIIDINHMLYTINYISQCWGLEVNDLPSVKGNYTQPMQVMVRPGRESPVPLELRNGKNIIITPQHPQLQRFDRNTLEEILEALNKKVCVKESFGKLRSQIVDALAEY